MQGLVCKLVVLQTNTTDIPNNSVTSYNKMSLLLCVVVALFYSINLVNAANENDCAQGETLN